MQRSFRQLAGRPFDVLVIGGGVYGAWAAYDAALRGLDVALIEAHDWASATSSASSKLIHGGLRYLEHFEFSLVRKSLDERRRLAWLAPHRVRPLRFVLPVYSGRGVGRFRLRVGLWIYDRLAGRGWQPAEGYGVVSRKTAVSRYGLRTRGLKGAFTYGDCQTDDARFVLEIVDGAHEAGAVVVNRARAATLLVEEGRVTGAEVQDVESGATCKVRAGVTVNCAGPWTPALAEPVCPGFSDKARLTKGVHLLLPALPVAGPGDEPEAFLLPSPDDRRIVFVIPWYGRTLLGTTDTDYEGDPARVAVETADVDYLLERARQALPDGAWSKADVISAFAGLRTLPAAPGRSPSAVSREWQLEQPAPGLLSAIGGKYTSARADSAVIIDRALRLLAREPVPCATGNRRFPWAPDEAYPDWSKETLLLGLSLGMDEETVVACQQRYGTRIGRLFQCLERSPETAERVVDDAPFCIAELIHAVTDEMALSLEDVLRRRVPLLLISRMNEESLRRAAHWVGRSLQWTEARGEEELRSVMDRLGAVAEAYAPD